MGASCRQDGGRGGVISPPPRCIELRRVYWRQNRPSPGASYHFGLRQIVETDAVLVDDSIGSMLDAVTAFMFDVTECFGVGTLTRDAVAWQE